MRRVSLTMTVAFIGVIAAGCSTPSPESVAQNDPYEKTNRQVFAFNMALDHNVAKPVAKAYNYVLPEFMRDGVHNVLDNLDKPVTFGNDVFQGESIRAGQTFARFFVNSTLGLGGMIDVASHTGLPNHSEDFGQTLAVWGAGEGPYLMMPGIGPSNPRDLAGKVPDFFMDPLLYAHYPYENLVNDMRMGLSLVDLRARNIDTLDQVERTSIDYYATTRSLYRQYRAAQIKNEDEDNTSSDPDKF